MFLKKRLTTGVTIALALCITLCSMLSVANENINTAAQANESQEQVSPAQNKEVGKKETGKNKAQINQPQPNEAQQNDGGFEWELMFEIGAAYRPSLFKGIKYQNNVGDYLSNAIYFDMSYKGFFLRSTPNRAVRNYGEIGYEVFSKDGWGLDLVVKLYTEGFDYDYVSKHQGKEIPILQGLKDRYYGGGIGLRYSLYQENTIFSAEVAKLDLGEDRTYWYGETYYSYLVPYKNWDIYFGAGLNFYPHNVADYYYSIAEDEVTSLREQYQAKSAFEAEFEVFAQYPLSESWSFNVGISQQFFTSGIADSPIFRNKNPTQFKLGVRYVL